MITRGVPFTSFVYFLPVGTLAILFGGGGCGDHVLFCLVMFSYVLLCFVLFCYIFSVFIVLLFCSA